MVKENEHITMENAKEFYFEHGCGSHFVWNMDPRIMEFYNLKIERGILEEWTNEYFTNKYNEYIICNNKSSIIGDILFNFKNELNYSIMKMYFEIYLKEINREEKNYYILCNLLEEYERDKKNIYEGIIYISYINNDYELMHKAIKILKRLIIELDGVEIVNSGIKGQKIETEEYSKYLSEFIEEHNITL